MKFFTALMLLTSLTTSFACPVYEAQFSSVVKEIITQNDASRGYRTYCQVKLDINLSEAGQSWNPSMFCPLDIEFVLDEYITVPSCNYQPGDEISGIIVQTPEGLHLD